MVIKQCKTCNEEFKTELWLVEMGKGKFCSQNCYWKSKEKKETVVCETCKKTFTDWICQKRKYCSFGCRKVWNKGLTKKKDSRVDYQRPTQFKMGQLMGSRHPQWKGGITDDRRSNKYKEFIKNAYKLFGYTCYFCDKKPGKLNVHHLKPWKYYPELRFELSNILVLCTDCHRQTDSYGKGVYKYSPERQYAYYTSIQ
mgnify:FL=1